MSKTKTPWEALLTDEGSLSSMKMEEVISQREEVLKSVESIGVAEMKRRAIYSKNMTTMKKAQTTLQSYKKNDNDSKSKAVRDHARGVLLQCSRISSLLFEQGVLIRAQQLEATNRLQTFDALLTYRRAASSAFALRHSSLSEGVRSLSRNNKAGSLESFTVLEGLGKGSFGAVFLVEHSFEEDQTEKKPKLILAIKMVAREIVANSEKRIRHLEIERRVMCQVREHPFIVTLHYALQSPSALYFVMDYCAGGDLFYHLCQLRHKPHPVSGQKHFREVEVQFFASQVVSALGHLHDHCIVYRDLKPENVMLDGKGFVKLVDFGLAKENVKLAFDDPVSPCGSAMYVAPEVLGFSGGFMIDWWSLGVLVYELLSGSPPWNTKDRKELFKQIRDMPIHVPRHASKDTADFILGLLQRNPAKRLGSQGDAAQLKASPFFTSWIDWNKMDAREYEPPFKPCEGTQRANFDAESSTAAMKALKALDSKQEEGAQSSAFLDFEPVTGTLSWSH